MVEAWKRHALIICIERGEDMIEHGRAIMMVYNEIAKFSSKYYDKMKNKLVVVPYSKESLPVKYVHDMVLF